MEWAQARGLPRIVTEVLIKFYQITDNGTALNKETIIGVIESIARKLIDSEKILTELDSQIGDADCGAGIKRGFEAVLAEVGRLRDCYLPDIFKKVGFTWPVLLEVHQEPCLARDL